MAGDGFTATIYPNPASTSAHVEVKGMKGPYTIMVENMQGRVLWKVEKVTDSNVKIPLTSFAGGIYIVTVFDGVHTGKLKLVKR